MPGRTMRSGAPWSLGSGWPFISYASSASPLLSSATSSGTLAPYHVSPSTSAPSNCTCSSPCSCRASRDSTPAYSSTSTSRAPPHVALEMAAPPHLRPLTGLTESISERRLPAHWSVAVTSCLGKDLRSSMLRESSRVRPGPSMVRRKASASMTGTGRWFRTKKRSLGVMKLSPSSTGGGSALNGLAELGRSAGWRTGSAEKGSFTSTCRWASSPGASSPMTRSARSSCTSSALWKLYSSQKGSRLEPAASMSLLAPPGWLATNSVTSYTLLP
mmetsp:Transcript_19406/g.65782  ORF Transcript_19406/g.65782 Transcript_19406/m.65782 type:complete len:273 (+) Transcript_19406:113-931(+)